MPLVKPKSPVFSSDQQRALDAVLQWRSALSKQHLTLGGYAGCLSGNTVLCYMRGTRKGHRPIDLSDLYLKFNGDYGSGRGQAQRWKNFRTVPTYLLSLWPDGTTAYNKIIAVFKSGMKKVIRLDFSDGNFLILTADHPVATADGFVAAGELSIGDKVLGRGSLRPRQDGNGKRPLSMRPDRVIVNTKYHPGPIKTVMCNGIAYDYVRVPRSRLVVEASINEVPYDDFVYTLKKSKSASRKFKFLPQSVDVHHLDENPLNDDLSNLEVVSHSEHARIHTTKRNNTDVEYVREVTVTATQSAGEEMTYDVQMEAPANNFLANGIFVHNTGKSTLVSHLANNLWPGCAVATFTGKAAQVLRTKKVPAQTIHSLIYEVETDDHGNFIDFHLRKSLPGVKELIIDEASMITSELDDHLMSFGLPVLYVGDHGQLEPTGDNPGLMLNPDVRLEKIHRQAANNPILYFADGLRNGRTAQELGGDDSQCMVTSKNDWEGFLAMDPTPQLVCGFNNTRHSINQIVRQGEGDLVYPGETLVCLKNNRSWGIFNGQQLEVRGVIEEHSQTIILSVETEDGRVLDHLPCLKAQFGQNTVECWDKSIALLDYGYCLTAHKSQGSEWDNVIVLEEIARTWDARRWRYTCATRAREALVYCV